MHLTRRDLLGAVLVIVTTIVSAVAYPELPAQLVTQFDAVGDPSDTLSKPVALAGIPALAAGLVVVFRILPEIDPLGENIAAFQAYYDLIAVVAVGLVAYVHGLLVIWNLGYQFPVTQALVPVLAVLYYVLGVVVENARQNWFVGIRTPWTLSSEEVWDRTHERSGILFKIAGVLALLAIPLPELFVYVAVGPIVVVALATTVYSYVVYRRVAAN